MQRVDAAVCRHVMYCCIAEAVPSILMLRWAATAAMHDAYAAIPALTGGTGEAKPTGQPVESCWFCLSNVGADLSLVVSVGEESYLVLDKGPITSTHVLMVPIEHFPSSISVSEACKQEVDR